MSTTITGFVTNGVVVPNTLLPEGTHVEIHPSDRFARHSAGLARLSGSALRMPGCQPNFDSAVEGLRDAFQHR
jgi:hypothetical protein